MVVMDTVMAATGWATMDTDMEAMATMDKFKLPFYFLLNHFGPAKYIQIFQ
jgi:hypothetical protein